MGRCVLLRFAACICSKSFFEVCQANVVPVIAYLRSSSSFDPPDEWKSILQDAFLKVSYRSTPWTQ